MTSDVKLTDLGPVVYIRCPKFNVYNLHRACLDALWRDQCAAAHKLVTSLTIILEEFKSIGIIITMNMNDAYIRKPKIGVEFLSYASAPITSE